MWDRPTFSNRVLKEIIVATKSLFRLESFLEVFEIPRRQISSTTIASLWVILESFIFRRFRKIWKFSKNLESFFLKIWKVFFWRFGKFFLKIWKVFLKTWVFRKDNFLGIFFKFYQDNYPSSLRALFSWFLFFGHFSKCAFSIFLN